MSSIETRIQKTREHILEVATKCGRSDEVQLLAVSKTKPAAMIREAWTGGQRAFGENYVQESVDKIQELSDLEGIEWHFIGPIQSNKSRLVAENFNWVHSVDRLKIARRLSEQLPDGKAPINICLQVNIDNEPTKSGFSASEVLAAAQEVIALKGVKLRGLMAIPAPSENKAQQKRPFKAIRALMDQLKAAHPEQQLDTLSMGTTADLDAAIEEGATIVRIGTALFGARDYSNK
ncbi:YggS family pyridoxal phosphate-dependent enzyme [Sansalvadorimonas verongulae]|uniref:YggS family pyridoxal phosphate-dependent enzyme n=1 Tax=Sansalvadorimonas verongulae TaxID=2172824 RepID=UPI0012BD3FAB|nr:YggS family pyridoxal phosphate-dependent enzyme [Sansalvadorimonas verongulae]MTI14967.1 YggS family pyridoxal phosphate-dependent enzyme [Sansalvadorimonas verongulae]